MSAFDNVYQVLVQGIPPQSPINGFQTPQGHLASLDTYMHAEPLLQSRYCRAVAAEPSWPFHPFYNAAFCRLFCYLVCNTKLGYVAATGQVPPECSGKD